MTKSEPTRVAALLRNITNVRVDLGPKSTIELIVHGSAVDLLRCDSPVAVALAALSDIEPHREILAIDPSAGRIARTGSVEDTFEAMRQVAAADLAAMGDHARRIVEHELSARVMSRKFQALYAALGR